METSELRIDALCRLKDELEDKRWRIKTTIKIAEVAGFMGTFLCSNPMGYLISVLITAIAIVCDFYVGYQEHKEQRMFQSLIT